jgi:hypothetical protein
VPTISSPTSSSKRHSGNIALERIHIDFNQYQVVVGSTSPIAMSVRSRPSSDITQGIYKSGFLWMRGKLDSKKSKRRYFKLTKTNLSCFKNEKVRRYGVPLLRPTLNL